MRVKLTRKLFLKIIEKGRKRRECYSHRLLTGASSCHFPKVSAAQCVHGNGRKLEGALSDHSACLPPSGFSTAAPSHVRHWSLGWTINPPSHLSIITKHAPSRPPSELDRPELSDGAPLLSVASQPDGALSGSQLAPSG